MIVAITGATGFVGAALCRHFLAHGHRVRGLARDPARAPEDLRLVEWYACELPDAIDEDGLAGPPDALIHCAFEMRDPDPERARRANVDGAKRLFELSREHGVGRILLISSFSAHPDAVSVYGRSKLEVEALLDPTRDVAVRLGHVIGEGGLFWRTARSIGAFPFIPLFFGGEQRIQTVHVDDVCEAVRRTLERELTGIVRVAEPEPVSLKEFYGAVATGLGKRPRFLRLPGMPLLAVLVLAERVGLRLPLSSDNLLGLRRLRTFDVAEDLERLGMTVQSMRDSIGRVSWRSVRAG